MFRNFTLAFLFLFVSLSASAQYYLHDSISVDAQMRQFFIHLPNSTPPAAEVPLVLVLHGMGDNAANFRNIGFSPLADTNNFIVVYPQGLLMNMVIQNVNAWRIGTPFDGNIDDVGFISDLIDTMKARYLVDTARVFVAGHSMGGFMSHRLACELNDKVAAIASNAGPLATATADSCTSDHVIPVLHIHGTADATVGYDASGPFAPFFSFNRADSTTAFWAALNECNTVPDSTRIPDTKNDGLTVDQFNYANCKDSSEVILYRVNGGTHTWWFDNSNDISSTKLIWEFFSRHKMGEADEAPNPTAINNAFIVTKLSIYPNPSTGWFIIETAGNTRQNMVVLNALGQQVLETTLQGDKTQVDLTGMAKGMYLFSISDATTGQPLGRYRVIVE